MLIDMNFKCECDCESGWVPPAYSHSSTAGPKGGLLMQVSAWNTCCVMEDKSHLATNSSAGNARKSCRWPRIRDRWLRSLPKLLLKSDRAQPVCLKTRLQNHLHHTTPSWCCPVLLLTETRCDHLTIPTMEIIPVTPDLLFGWAKLKTLLSL